MLTSNQRARFPAQAGCKRGMSVAGRSFLLAVVALAGAPALSWAQGLDLQVTGLQLSPPAPRAGDSVTVSAVIRRTGAGDPVLKDPVAVDVEFLIAGEAKAFAVRKVTLGPEQSKGVEAVWKAQPGQHVVGVRVMRITTFKGQPLKDAKPDNDQTMMKVLVATATKEQPEHRPAEAPPVLPRPPGVAAPRPAASGAITGFLMVPADIRSRYRVTAGGPNGWRGTFDASGEGERRPYRMEGLYPGNYQLEPEALADTPSGPIPGGSWVPRRGQVNLRQGERLEGPWGVDFRFEPFRMATESRAVPPRLDVPLPPATPAARPLSTLNGLRVNGGGFSTPMTVRWGGTATVEWNLPGTDGDALHLLVSRYLPPYCPSSIGNSWFESLPGAGRVTPVPTGSVPLPIDRPEYLVGQQYYLKGCLMRAGVPTGDETNTVVVDFVDDPVRRELARHAGPPDLVVRDIRLLRGGDADGRFLITIADLNGSRAASASSFRYEVFFNDETTPRLRGVVAPGQWVGGGVPFLITDSAGLVPTEPRGAAVVRVMVNGDRAYAETDYDNDTLERYVGWQDEMTSARWHDGLQVLRVHDVYKVDEAPSWVLLGVRYTYTGFARPADYVSLTVPTAGRDTVSCRGPVSVWESPGPTLPRGVNQVVHFLCGASAFLPSFATDVVVVTPRDGTPPAYAPVAERRFRLVKRWDPLAGPAGPELPDLKVRILNRFSARLRAAAPHPPPGDPWGRPTTWLPISAVGGRIDLRVANRGRVPSREGVGWVRIREGTPLTCGDWNAVVLTSSAVPATRPPEGRSSWSGSFPVPPLAVLEGRTFSITIDPSAEITCNSHVTIGVTTPDIDDSPADNLIGVLEERGMPPPETQWDGPVQTDAEAWGSP